MTKNDKTTQSKPEVKKRAPSTKKELVLERKDLFEEKIVTQEVLPPVQDLKFTQGTLEWLEMRKMYIGASDTPIILGLAKWKLKDGRTKTPYILWQEKLGLYHGDASSYATEYGHRMEAEARSAYEAMTGEFVSAEIVFHKHIPFMMASLDGLTIDKDLAVEIKNINAADHELARQGIVPPIYYAQVQHQLMCLGHERMHYFSYHKGEGIVVEVKKDPEYQAMITEKLLEFWQCIENFSSPAMADEDHVEKGEQWDLLADELFKLKALIKNYELQKEFLEESLKEISENTSCISKNYRYTKAVQKGRVDYDLIPELKGVDLDKYRKAPSTKWSLYSRKY